MSEAKQQDTQITLEDIENMIEVLEQFIRLSRRAERIVRYLAPSRNTGRDDFMQMFMRQALERSVAGHGGLLSDAYSEYEEAELDEDTKATIEKIRARKKAESQKQG